MFEGAKFYNRLEKNHCGELLKNVKRWEHFPSGAVINPDLVPTGQTRLFMLQNEINDAEEMGHMRLTRLLGEDVLTDEFMESRGLDSSWRKPILIALSAHDYHEGLFGDLAFKTKEDKLNEQIILKNQWADIARLNPLSPQYLAHSQLALDILLTDPKIKEKYGATDQELIARNLPTNATEEIKACGELFNEVHDLSFVLASTSNQDTNLEAKAVKCEVALKQTLPLYKLANQNEFIARLFKKNVSGLYNNLWDGIESPELSDWMIENNRSFNYYKAKGLMQLIEDLT